MGRSALRVATRRPSARARANHQPTASSTVSGRAATTSTRSIALSSTTCTAASASQPMRRTASCTRSACTRIAATRSSAATPVGTPADRVSSGTAPSLEVVTLVDLRSDTLTHPTDAMRAAMAAAEVGDDVYGEDPAVNRLEEQVAGLFGHEAAVFVPSGTMGNQICLRLVVPSGEELVCDADAHVVTYEHGGAAQHGGIQSRTLPGGLLDPGQVEAFLRPAGWGTVATSALSVEQTHNRGGGAVHPLEVLQELRRLTSDKGMALHCDGARVWNAAVATGTDLAAYGRLF